MIARGALLQLNKPFMRSLPELLNKTRNHSYFGSFLKPEKYLQCAREIMCLFLLQINEQVTTPNDQIYIQMSNMRGWRGNNTAVSMSREGRPVDYQGALLGMQGVPCTLRGASPGWGNSTAVKAHISMLRYFFDWNKLYDELHSDNTKVERQYHVNFSALNGCINLGSEEYICLHDKKNTQVHKSTDSWSILVVL